MSDIVREGLVIVGRKPVMNYVVACLSVFNSGVACIRVKARGLAICRAVEVIMLLKKAFIKNLVIQNITIDTQDFSRPNRQDTRVSTIDILLIKP